MSKNSTDTGEGAVLVDNRPERVRGDMRLIGRALKERWPVTQESMDNVFRKVEEIALTFPDPVVSLQAAKLIATMHGQNQKDEPQIQQIEHHHSVEAITVENIDEQRTELHRRLNRLRRQS
jgi:hypothetical protein